MLIVSLIFAAFVQGQEHTFSWTVADAQCSTSTTQLDCGGDWSYRSSFMDWHPVSLSAGETKTFAVDYNNLEGTKANGATVTLTDDRSADLNAIANTGSINDIEIGGEFEDCNDQDCHSSIIGDQISQSKCNFQKNSVKQFTVRNKGTQAVALSMYIDIDGNDELCGFLDDVAKWLTTVLIIIGVCCGIGIIAIICCMCGGVACCCAAANNNKGSTTTTQTQTTQMATGAPMPSQPAYGGPPGGSGRDLTQYSTGLQPGWEAKFDESAGKPYWVNHNSQTSTWDDPRGP